MPPLRAALYAKCLLWQSAVARAARTPSSSRQVELVQQTLEPCIATKRIEKRVGADVDEPRVPHAQALVESGKRGVFFAALRIELGELIARSGAVQLVELLNRSRRGVSMAEALVEDPFARQPEHVICRNLRIGCAGLVIFAEQHERIALEDQRGRDPRN